jgi:hypothetical protein
MAAGTRDIIEISPPTEDSKRLWEQLIALAKDLGEDERWALVGGLMVQLHALEHMSDTRLTRDIDLLGDARRRPSMTQRIAETLQGLGAAMRMPPATDEDLGYQFDLNGQLVEVLGTEGLRGDPKTIGKYSTIQIHGGTQALNRTEVVMVSIDGGAPVAVPRPSLLGAILIKARAVAKERKEKFDSDRQDLILLLSLVDDPRALAAAEGLKGTEKKWLRSVEAKLDFSEVALLDASDSEQLARARQAFALLIA